MLATIASRFLLAAVAASAASETHTRQLWNDAFLKQREEAAPARKPARARPAPADADRAGDRGEAFVGVTLWRLRPATARDRDQGLVLFRSETEELVAERVEAGTVFVPGDKVRIGVESARKGYLYLLDREKY